MNATHVEAGYQSAHQEEVSLRTMTNSALMESIGAVAALILAIAGLAGAFPTTLAAIGAIVLGAAIWIEAGTFAAYRRTESLEEGAQARTLEWNEGLGAEFLGGLSGIVLGILALLGVVPITLLSIAVL